MSRYIDAEKLICDIDGSECLDTERDYEEVARRIDECETADVEEVRHGEWVQTFEPLGWQEVECAACSVCGESVILTDSDMDIDDIRNWWNYCPMCGARMDGKEKNDDEL